MIMSLREELSRSQGQSKGRVVTLFSFWCGSAAVTLGKLLNLSGSPFQGLIHKGVETSNLCQNLNNDAGYLEE